MVNGVHQLKFGTVCLVPADNLASCALGGFKEGSTAYRGCRHCLATPQEISSVFSESQLELRTSEDHVSKCTEMDSASTQQERNELSVEYGINHKSILEDLEYFSVCGGTLIQDVMHDVLEGTISYCHVIVNSVSIFCRSPGI